MMSRGFWNLITNRLVSLYPGLTIHDVFAKKLVLLVGDHRQLPPVCHCKVLDPKIQCARCDITTCNLFKGSTKHRLVQMERHAKDPEHSAFCSTIRVRPPTQPEIDRWMQPHMPISEEALLHEAQPSDRIICSLKKHVRLCNHAQLVKDCAQRGVKQEVLTVQCYECKSPAGLKRTLPTDIPASEASQYPQDMLTWLEDKNWNLMPEAAVGSPVICMKPLGVGKANGATGKIAAFGREDPADDNSRINKIVVDMDMGGQQTFTQTETSNTWVDGRRFTKHGFPLALAYAITGHKSQGATYTTRTFIWLGAAFAPGLLYVMLSRVTQRSLLRIVGALTPDLFNPARAVRGLDDDADLPDDIMAEGPVEEAEEEIDNLERESEDEDEDE